MTILPEIEFRVLAALEAGEIVPLSELVARVGKAADAAEGKEGAVSDQAYVMAGVKMLADKGLVVVYETEEEEILLVAEKGESYCFPERRALEAIGRAQGTVSLEELSRLLGKEDVRSEVKWLTRKGWCSREAGLLVLTETGQRVLAGQEVGADEQLVSLLLPGVPVSVSELREKYPQLDVDAARQLLRGRDDIIRRKRRVRRTVQLTKQGVTLKAEGIAPAREVTQLTPELLVSGRWREGVVFKRYDVKLATAPRYPGKRHPLQRVIQETRRAFLEMGFEEVESPVVETAFWDFDALFQPQDHPAREMQDTFYLKEPSVGVLPDPELVERVARTHESGGDTGSTGWRYKWDVNKARQLVLRTHTTAATIRAVAENPKPPRKVFSIGRVFRRENIDATHLPEFVQIDGIIIDEEANLATLLGTLAEFYRKMGAKEVRFRPSFFPYTEPSAEVFAYVEGLGWVEMCGSGVFRPEVTRPLGCTSPVIAWGGGLERIAMLCFGLDDIRKLYWADVEWLREAKLCR